MPTKYAAQKLSAPRDVNGNSRRGWLIYQLHQIGLGQPVLFLDPQEFYKFQKEYPGSDLLDYEVKITATEYKRLRKKY